ncbi:MAG TPA: hypothetical protein VFR67_26545, partial [Pilimelia sp.]|nr:hypothetical protein [Pilimelia sp.]
MTRAASVFRRSAALVGAAAIAAYAFVGPTATAALDHQTVVGAVPTTQSPDISDETVFAIYDTGAKVIAGGSFSRVQNRNSDVDISRRYVLAFSKATGLVDTAFAPVVDGQVLAVAAGPTAGTVYIAGEFNRVNGVTRRKLALLNVADGSLVTTFSGPNFNRSVKTIALVGNRLLVGGGFTTAGVGNPRGGLASVNATTGVLDTYLTVSLTENHNWTLGSTGAKGQVGADSFAVSPDGGQLVVVGNFKRANGILHDQVVKLVLGNTTATIANWNTTRFQARCRAAGFDSYMRDTAFSPDGRYFVIVTTGGPVSGTLCDAATRWEASATGSTLQPTWIDYAGGDTFLSVAISEQAIYVGGHLRWVNNTLGSGTARAGAVGRASIAALDPLSGLPLAWNPGRHPRGYGVAELHLTNDGLWLGHDQDWMGNVQYRRERIAFLPLAGGATVHSTAPAALPGNVYLAGNLGGATNSTVVRRSYNGGDTVGAAAAVANPDGTAWTNARGGFWVGGTLFYGMNGALQRRGFDGSAFGPARLVDPYHDALWDTVVTDGNGPEGQTYAGVASNFYGEINNVTGMFYTAGRLYYTLNGQTGLYWRWFTPDSGTVGADRFTVAGTTAFG